MIAATTSTDPRLATLQKTCTTRSERLGHQMGAWRPTDTRGETVAVCALCDGEAKAHDYGWSRGYHHLDRECPRKSRAVRQAEADAKSRAEYRARFEWGWLRTGELLADGHRCGVDLEVRLARGVVPFSRPERIEWSAQVEIPHVYYRTFTHRETGSPAHVTGKGENQADAIAALRLKLVAYLRDHDQRVATAQELRDHVATFVAPPAAGATT